MALEVTGDTFYLVQLPGGNTLHDSEEDAIGYLEKNAKDVNPDSDDVSVVRVSVEGEDWTIAELSWQNIALRLMGGE